MTLKMAKPRCGRILAREGVRFQCHFCKAIWEFSGSWGSLWLMQGVPDKEMGAFLTSQIKKGKENYSAPKLLGHVDSVMIRKTSAMATHCQTVEWAAWKSWGKPFCLLYLARASPWPNAPQYSGGTLANLEDINLICSCYTYPERQPDLNKIVTGGSLQEKERAILDGKTEADGSGSQRWNLFCIF